MKSENKITRKMTYLLEDRKKSNKIVNKLKDKNGKIKEVIDNPIIMEEDLNIVVSNFEEVKTQQEKIYKYHMLIPYPKITGWTKQVSQW